MSVKLEFIDTNILLYAHDPSEPAKHAKSKALLERLWQERTGCLSVQVLQEFFVNATRKLSIPLEITTARTVIEDYSQWIVHTPTPKDVLAAVDVHTNHRTSFWDALILTSALELGCAFVWSEDLNSGQKYAGMEVKNPFAI
jgi:predicted nucleic acid-binding protein